MLKRIASFCCFLLLMCSVIIPAAAYEDIASSNNEEAIEFLSAHGVISGYEDGSFRPEGLVTRAEFTAMLIRLQNQGITGDVNKTYYPDVTAEHWALSDINTATSQGLIAGYDDGSFRPDSNVTLTDAAKMILCMLGYEPVISAGKGYPQGYIDAAIENGIFKGITKDCEQYASRDDASAMLYNALEVGMLERSGDGYRKTERNILNTMLKLFKKKGVITATKYAELTPSGDLSEDEIAVDGVKYKITDEFIHELVGYQITFYAKEEEEDYVITYYNVKTEETVLVSAAEVIAGSCTKEVFSYTDEAGRKRLLKLDAAYVVKNGTSIPLSDAAVFDITDGNILLIDNDGNGYFENVFINEIKNIVVGRINKTDKIIADKFSGNRKLSLSDEEDDKKIVIRYNDEEISFEDLAEGDIIAYTESDVRIIAYVSRKTVSGAVKAIGSDAADRATVELDDGTGYRLSGECFTELNNYPEKKNALIPGAEVTLYLNVYNEIAQLEIGGLVQEKYAFLVTARYDSEQESAVLTLWPENGSVEKIVVEEEVRLDDGSSSMKVSPSVLVQKLEETRLVTRDSYVSNPYFQLIKYTEKEDGIIQKIRLAKSSADGKPLRKEGLFTRDLLASSVKTNGKNIINGAYMISENTKIFNIPPEHNAYSKYSDTITLAKNVTATVAIYDMNEGNEIDALLVINPDYDSYYDNSSYKPFFIYDHTVAAINEDDEVVYDVYGMYNRGMRAFRFESDPEFEKGDIYQFLEVDGAAAKANKIYDAELRKFAAAAANSSGLGIKGNVNAEVVLGVMQVRYADSSTLVVTDGATELMLIISSGTRCTLNDELEIRNADVSEIEVGDIVAFRTFNATAGDLVIIR